VVSYIETLMSACHLSLPAIFRMPLGAGIALLEARRSRLAAEAGQPEPAGGFIDRHIVAVRNARERELRSKYTIIPNPPTHA